MRNKLFDEHVKMQFDGYRPEVAPHIWEKIAAEQGRKKPAPFWLSLFSNKWMVAALLLVAAAGTGVYVASRNSSKPAHEQSVAGTEKAASGDNSTAATNTTSDTKNTTAPSANNDDQAVSNNASSNTTSSSPVSNQPAGSNTVNIQNSNNGTLPGNDALSGNTISNSSKRNKSRNAGSNTGFSISSPDATIDQQLPESTNPVAGTFASRIALSRTARPFDLLTGKSSLAAAKLNLKKLPAARTIPCPPAERDAAGNKSYFEVYAGPDYNFRSFSDVAGSSYLNERKATVSAAFSYSAGVRYTKVFRNGVSFRTGLNYSRANERFKYVKGNVTHNIYITNTAGDTTGTYTERGTQYQQSTNSYHSLDIPLVAGYELGNGRIHANVNAGVMINILSRQKGYVLDPSGTPVDISTGKSSTAYSYKTSAGVSFLGSFSVYYKLNDKFHLLAEPYLKYGLSSVTKTDISLKQKNHTAGLRIGLRRDL